MSDTDTYLPPADLYRIRDEDAIPSPALLFYQAPMQRNIAAMVKIAGDAGRLRPHVKTHKCPQVVRLCMEAGITKFKCATLSEAHMLAETGAKDIVIAYQLSRPDIAAFARLRRAYPAVDFMPLVDNISSLNELASVGAPPCRVLIDLNVGMDRTGIPPKEAAVRLYRRMAEMPGIEPGGIHAYDGHITEAIPQVRSSKADMGYSLVQELRDRLESESLPVPRVVMGGTPTFPCHATRRGIELSPGTCVLHDDGYLHKFRDLPFEPAALVLSRVNSVPYPGRMTLDCGSKAICSDPPERRGVILNIPGAIPGKQSEEHWCFDLPEKQAMMPGDTAYILPTHICTTVARYSQAWVIDSEGGIAGTWPIAARDRFLTI